MKDSAQFPGLAFTVYVNRAISFTPAVLAAAQSFFIFSKKDAGSDLAV